MLDPEELEADQDRFATLGGLPLVGSRLRAQAEKLANMEGDDLAQQMNSSIVRNLPKGVFLLVPVFALVLRLYYLRRKRRYAEHFVFALHVPAFAFLILSVGIFVPWQIVKIIPSFRPSPSDRAESAPRIRGMEYTGPLSPPGDVLCCQYYSSPFWS